MRRSFYVAAGMLLLTLFLNQVYAASCPKCGQVFSDDHSLQGSDWSYKQRIRQEHINNCGGGGGGGGWNGGGSNQTYEERLATFRRFNYPLRLMMLPIFMAWTPMLMLNSMVIAQKEYNDYLFNVMLIFTEPIWIVPYGICKGFYHYFAMDVFEETPAEYSTKVSKVSSAAYDRQKGRAMSPPATPSTRKSGMDAYIAQLNRDAVKSAQTSQIQRLMSGLRETQKKMDRPSARARLIGQSLAPISEEAMHSIKNKKSSAKDDLLMGAFNVGTAAFGPAGATVNKVATTALDTADLADDLVVMETSRMENQAKRLSTLRKLLDEAGKLPPEERKAEIKRVLAEAKPLLDASAKNQMDSGWSMVGKAASRKENWAVTIPELRKKIISMGVGEALGAVGPKVHRWTNANLRIRGWDKVYKKQLTRRFFESGASQVVAEGASYSMGKATEPAVSLADSVVDGLTSKESE